MSVYVDDMLRPATVGRVRACWSHLMADTHDELAQFALDLGLRPEWIQHPGTYREHFDVTTVRRQDAIALGAVEISYPRGTAQVLARKRLAEDGRRLASALDDLIVSGVAPSDLELPLHPDDADRDGPC